ncbi:MAG: hypothetical protein ACFFCD_08615 [Promethearchaeota archaeon]
MELENAPDVCFEVSFEIGNKVGGIYQVIASKAKYMKLAYGSENYYGIGFYNLYRAKDDFIEMTPPREFEWIFRKLGDAGIKVYFGRWIGGDESFVFLIDSRDFMNRMILKPDGQTVRQVDDIKGLFWEEYKIDSLMMGFDYDEPVAWSWAAGMLIEGLLTVPQFTFKRVVAQFHEWLAGAGLLYLKLQNIKIGKVFTTHATILARKKAEAGHDLIKEVDEALEKGGMMVDQGQAFHFKLEGKHLMEQVCCREADVLTTVSEITAKEISYIHGVDQMMITPNGLDFSSILKGEDCKTRRRRTRPKIIRFIEAFFAPWYNVKTENALIVHLSGRYEFVNKGIDVFIQALSNLNELLRNNESGKNVFAFIWVPAAILNSREDVKSAVSHYSMVAEKLAPFLFKIEDDVIHMLYEGRIEEVFEKKLKEFFKDDFNQTIKDFETVKEQITEKTRTLPICTHNLLVPNDAIITAANAANLRNEEGDRVKIIFMPIYLSQKDDFLNLNYFDAISATDVGVYPSVYEPFGYTPLEAASRCVIAITTDLTGYGYSLLGIQSNKTQENLGIKILRRHGRSSHEIIEDLSQILFEISQLSQEKLEELKQNAKQLAEKSDWSHLIRAYIDAHTTAWERC